MVPETWSVRMKHEVTHAPGSGNTRLWRRMAPSAIPELQETAMLQIVYTIDVQRHDKDRTLLLLK
jgi:hypothetical protein